MLFRSEGPIRLLTHLRYFGYGFNPVSFYYCFDHADERVVCMVAEVNNTPWGERHCYVMREPVCETAGETSTYRTYHSNKVFHVSPFMPMNLCYDWGFSQPGAHIKPLNVHMRLHAAQDQANKVFDATLMLTRVPITGASLASMLTLYPAMTAQVIAGIHWEALKLWLKGVPVHTHPRKLTPPPPLPDTSAVHKLP